MRKRKSKMVLNLYSIKTLSPESLELPKRAVGSKEK